MYSVLLFWAAYFPRPEINKRKLIDFMPPLTNWRGRNQPETSWAGSATLGYKSWARLIFQLRPRISVDRLRHRTTFGGGHRTLKCVHIFLLRIQDRTKCGKDTGLHWGEHRTDKTFTGRVDTAHTCLIGWTIGVGMGGTPHKLCWWGEQLGWGHRTTLKETASP